MASWLDDLSAGMRTIPENLNLKGAATAIGNRLGQLPDTLRENRGTIASILQTAGRALSPVVYQQWRQAQAQQRQLILQGTIAAIENGSLDPEKGRAVLKAQGFEMPEGAGFGPSVQAQKSAAEEARRKALEDTDASIRASVFNGAFEGGPSNDASIGPAPENKNVEGGVASPTVTVQNFDADAEAEKFLRYADKLKRSGNADLVQRGLKLEKDIRENIELQRKGKFRPNLEELALADKEGKAVLDDKGKPLFQKGYYDQANKWVPQGAAYPKGALAEVNVDTKVNPAIVETAYGKELGQKQAGQDLTLQATASRAPQLAERALRISELLDSQQVITGAAADFRLNLARAAKLAGYEDASVANTEELAAGLAGNTLDSIKESGLGTGQGFTNKDLEFLEKARGGNIKMDRESLKRMTSLAYKAAEESAKKWNARAGKIPKSAVEGVGLDITPVEIPKRKLDAVLKKYGDKK